MNKAPITAYIEGKTETSVLTKLAKRGLIEHGLIDIANKLGGKDEARKALKLGLREWSREPLEIRKPLSLLVLRDQDQQKPEQIVDFVQTLLRQQTTLPNPKLLLFKDKEDGIHTLLAPTHKLRLALVISRWKGVQDYFPEIHNHAMDDYILALAMRRPTAAAILAGQKDIQHGLSSESLLAMVQTEIPAMLAKHGQLPPISAKDHIGFYTALLGDFLSPKLFAEKVIEHADKDDLRSHFASLLAAVAFLSPPTT